MNDGAEPLSQVLRHCGDDFRHTVFVCDVWYRKRSKLKQYLTQIYKNEEFAPETMVLIMLRSKDGWKKLSAFACQVMKCKMDAEWARQA